VSHAPPTTEVVPTDEQEDAIGLFLSGMDMKIEAGAGTGKTSTLEMMARERSRAIGQYVVFNRAAAVDASARMPVSVTCSTINSVAARATDRALLDRLNAPRRASRQTARDLGIDRGVYFRVRDQARVLSASWLSSHVMRALGAFCYSADPEPRLSHFPLVESLDDDRENWPNNYNLANMLLRFLEVAWMDMATPEGKLRFTHDCYLKQWALREPRLPVDFLLVDEAQDLSPVHIGVFANQDCQVAWVGDSCQQIYEWRGAENALAKIETWVETYLTRSFRFGQPIADAANLVLALLPTKLRLTGDPGRTSHVSRMAQRPDAVLTRTNAVAVARTMAYQKQGVAVHLVGGGAEVMAFAKAALQLQETGTCNHIELGCFDSWRAVQQYVYDDPLGGELKLLVNLVDEYGAEAIIEALDDMIAEERADVVISTAHKAKGREWPRVQLASDFPDYAVCSPEEWRLLYVALTRAREVVDPYLTDSWRALTNGALR
jgi:hypothetical protein